MASYNDWVSQMQGWGQLGSGTYPFPNGINQQPLAPIMPGIPSMASPVAAPVASPNWGSSWDATDAAGVSTNTVASVPGSGGMWSDFGNWMKSSGMLGSYDPKTGMKTDGWGGLALGAAQGLGGLYLGMQQYNLAKQALAASKDQFERNFAAQRQTTNARLEDRQAARVASNAGAYQSVSDYMNKYGVR